MPRNKLILFVLVPVCLNLVMIGLYYSGNQYAQSLVAPKIEWLHRRSWREFGLLEMLQNLFLLSIIVLFCLQLVKRKLPLERLFFLCGALIMAFLLLEEIDYGIHYYEYYVGHQVVMDLNARNWHNNASSGESVTARLKQIVDTVMVFWFILFPLLSRRVRFSHLQGILPSRWFVAGFILSVLFSELAHYLDDLNLDTIQGAKGSLDDNVSEFRETTNYYLFLLYALQLVTTKNLFSGGSRELKDNA